MSMVWAVLAWGFLPLAAGSWSYEVALVSKYIWRGFDLSHDMPALQQGVTFSHEKGFSVTLWGSYTLDRHRDLDELDLTLEHGWSVTRGFCFAVGYTHYTFPSADQKTNEGYVRVEASFLPWSPSLSLFYDWDEGRGLYVLLSGTKDFTVSGSIPPLSASIGVGFNSKQWQDKTGISDVALSLSIALQLGRWSIIPSLNYVLVPLSTVNPEDEFWAGLLLSSHF